MKRRLYFLFPDVEHTRAVLEELRAEGIDDRHMHAMARQDIDLQSLPAASLRQQRDICCTVENIAWNVNLAVFGIAFAALVIAAWQGSLAVSLTAVAIMAITFLAGERFAASVPRAHLDEFRDALAHGEVLLTVDVARARVPEVQDIVHRRHPEAVVGGAGWTVAALEH